MSTESYWGVNRMLPEPEPEECDECGHDVSLHADRYGCQFERGDAWVTGNQPEQPTVLMAQGPCGCKAVDEFQALLAHHWQALQGEA